MKPLAIIPTYLRSSHELPLVASTLRTLRETAGHDCDVLVVDDGSPAEDLRDALLGLGADYDADIELKEENEGFATTVNVGLRRCLEQDRDAVLINADVEFGLTRDWLGLMERQQGEDGKPAAIVGALLLYPVGLIQHGGIYFSLLTRTFGHRFQYGPGDLAEAQLAAVCPVTGALQFIRHDCLEQVGLYDESFRLGWEDCDYCVRTWLHDLQCIYQPGIRAVHHESAFRGQVNEKIARWTNESWLRFAGKYAEVSFASFVPNTLW